ncbi:MAG: xylose isomerase, partial [Phocaeicola sp.]
ADLFIAHIGGMDVFALGLEKAAKLCDDGRISAMKKERYASFNTGDGAKFEKGDLCLAGLASLVKPYDQVAQISGKQELYENIVNEILFG